MLSAFENICYYMDLNYVKETWKSSFPQCQLNFFHFSVFCKDDKTSEFTSENNVRKKYFFSLKKIYVTVIQSLCDVK